MERHIFWMDAAFFNGSVSTIMYCDGDSKKVFSPESEEGKKVISMLKKRFGTHEVMPQAEMKVGKHWKKNCKYLKIEFKDICETGMPAKPLPFVPLFDFDFFKVHKAEKSAEKHIV